ncbi:MAG: permease [Rheinheimera sp.]|nr:permease [Rheinheimera sp.]
MIGLLPMATLIGVPIYADIFGTLPIAEALVAKGVGIGTVLAFMMSITAFSLPSLVMLHKVVKARLLGLFVGIIVHFGIMLIGWLFDSFGNLLV